MTQDVDETGGLLSSAQMDLVRDVVRTLREAAELDPDIVPKGLIFTGAPQADDSERTGQILDEFLRMSSG